MSKKAKAESKERRLKEKRARKSMMQAQYETWRREGKNRKSKRFQQSSGKKLVKNAKHNIGYCGNLACDKCHVDLNNPWHANKRSCIYRKRWTSPKWRTNG